MGDSDDKAGKRNLRKKFNYERSDYDRYEIRKSHNVAYTVKEGKL